jgi:hypothetical protein
VNRQASSERALASQTRHRPVAHPSHEWGGGLSAEPAVGVAAILEDPSEAMSARLNSETERQRD